MIFRENKCHSYFQTKEFSNLVIKCWSSTSSQGTLIISLRLQSEKGQESGQPIFAPIFSDISTSSAILEFSLTLFHHGSNFFKKYPVKKGSEDPERYGIWLLTLSWKLKMFSLSFGDQFLELEIWERVNISSNNYYFQITLLCFKRIGLDTLGKWNLLVPLVSGRSSLPIIFLSSISPFQFGIKGMNRLPSEELVGFPTKNKIA